MTDKIEKKVTDKKSKINKKGKKVNNSKVDNKVETDSKVDNKFETDNKVENEAIDNKVDNKVETDSKVDSKVETEVIDNKVESKVANKKSKKVKKLDNKKRIKLEEDDFYNEIQDLLKNADYDKKTLEQKIDLAWLDSKGNFVNLIRQKNMYNKISLLFNKGSPSTRYDIVSSTIKNIIEVSSHEHSRQFIITLAKDNKKYLVLIIKKLKEVCREIVSNRNGLYVLEEVYKMANRKCRGEIVLAILDLEEMSEEEDNEKSECDQEGECDNYEEDQEGECDQEDQEGECDQEGDCCDHDHEDPEHEGDCCDHDINEEDNEFDSLKAENDSLIKKLSSKRLWKYEITHHLLLEYLTIYPSSSSYILDLFIRNKQMNLLLQTYKGLEVCLLLLTKDTLQEILRIITPDFINIVNNEYGVIFILKIMELEEFNIIIDLYTKHYKDIFINEGSVLPLLYIFNQERKYFPTLFNQVRSRELINIDKTYLLSKYKEIIIKHIQVFMKSFSWILVYFFSKKDEEIKKVVIKTFKEIESNENSEKLKKKMIKYKLMK